MAYKKDIADVRESPALDMIELLRAKGADVRYHDPYVPTISYNGYGMQGEPDLGIDVAGHLVGRAEPRWGVYPVKF